MTDATSGSTGSSGAIADQMQNAEAEFQSESVAAMKQQSEFAQMQAQSSIGNSIAKANPAQ
jgi:hypothetical protein